MTAHPLQRQAVRSPDIRERFLHYFEDRGHRRLASSSLTPHDDPSILFTIAGMVPLKPYFLGQAQPPAPRATSCQKCFRTVDIEEVGYTPRHDTFFEMLGNFSFGDYFKEMAVPFAWELLTDEYGLDPARLWPSIHPGDAAALELWTHTIGVPDQRVVRLEDNFWEVGAGLPGPCGYDSEIYWDRQVECSCGRPDCLPGCDGDRWVEIWNLVFMEFDRDVAGAMTPLPRPSIDTGLGLERLTAVLQEEDSIFDTDLFAPIMASVARRSADQLAPEQRIVSLRVCADHVRAATFLLGDGVRFAPTGAGYVMRRMVRRALLHARRLGVTGHLADHVASVVEIMAPGYPELIEHRGRIEQELREEEDAFARTLEAGSDRLERLLSGGLTQIGGDDAFRLHDTYGLPIELTVELAAQGGVDVDLDAYQRAMDAARAQSGGRVNRQGFVAGGVDVPETEFVGYGTLSTQAIVLQVGAPARPIAAAGDDSTAVFLDRTPFYAMSGGQVGDAGSLRWSDGEASVVDTTFVPGSRVRAHEVRVLRGELRVGMAVTAEVDAQRRARVTRHHSATHLLHRALRDLLGETALQRGSFVGPEYTTFDFAFGRALTTVELHAVEHHVNEAIRENRQRHVEHLSQAEARASGAMALFDEKYGEVVRVVDFGRGARELCGGTHVDRSGDIGAAIVLSEQSIGSGLRRIEMHVGDAAETLWQRQGETLRSAATALRARPDELVERITGLQAQLRTSHRQLEATRRGGGTGTDGLASATLEEQAGLSFVHLLLEGPEVTAEQVVNLTDRLFAERTQGRGVVVVMGPAALAVKVGADARQRGVAAGALVKLVAELTGGRGGGRPEFARGGIGDAARRGVALAAIRDALAGASR